MSSFLTITDSTAEIIVLRSKFIAFAFHIETEEQAAERLALLKKKYFDSTHVCYAYVLDVNGMITKCSDDGEPSSTAGAPILNVILGNKYRQTMIAVVRYFGGTKLGVGGLVKAYTDAATAAINNSTVITLVRSNIYDVETDYNTFKKINNALLRGGAKIIDVEYTQNVKIVFALPIESELINELVNITGGKIEFHNRGDKYENYQM